MDQSLKSPGQNALEDAFHRLFELTRTTPAPGLAERLDRLARLRAAVSDNEARFEQAISADFGHRCTIETTIAETMMLLGEIKHAAKSLKQWMAPKRVATSLQFFPAKNRLMPQPLGVVGIIAPWNYPLQLTLAPAVGAIAAGNRVMIKPSELVPRFSALLREVIAAKFSADEMIVTGIEDEISKAFASLPFDHLIFTGSTRVGRLVAEAAGRNLTPVTLELGGKSPVIVDRSADLAEAAERIAYAKLLNAGQTCIAPDYVLVPEASVQDFADRLQANMQRMFGTDPDNKDYTSIVSDRHYARLEGLVADAAAKGARIMQGGETRRSRLEIETQISADHRGRRDVRDGDHAGGNLRAAAAGDGLQGRGRTGGLYQQARPAAGAVLVRQGRCGARRGAGPHRLRRRHRQRLPVSLRPDVPADGRRRRVRHRRLSRRMGFQYLEQAEAGVLSLAVQPPRRSLSALRRQDRAAAKDAAIFVVALQTVIPGWSEATETRNLEIPGSMLPHRPGMTQQKSKWGKYA